MSLSVNGPPAGSLVSTMLRTTPAAQQNGPPRTVPETQAAPALATMQMATAVLGALVDTQA